jgi:hypothetical protein
VSGLQPWEKSPQLFLSLSLSSPNKQKTEHQSESNSATSWTPSPLTLSLCHATLTKASHFSLPVGSKVAETAEEQVCIMHHTQLPYSPSGKMTQQSPWAYWTVLAQEKWKT